MDAGCIKNEINGNRNIHNSLRQRSFQFFNGVAKADLHPLETGMVVSTLLINRSKEDSTSPHKHAVD